MKRVLVFASGSATGGGSGFATMVKMSQGAEPVLDAEIVGVVSNHANGGVREKAEQYKIPFLHFAAPFTALKYQEVVKHFAADYVMLSGWLKLVKGLEMAKTINIHPGPLPLTQGLHGMQVHERVLQAFRAGELARSKLTMHFVDESYDTGPIIFEKPVNIFPDDTPEMLQQRVNALEHAYQSLVLNYVIHGRIVLKGREVLNLDG
jgi:phosphoribosylglycinamide formyltransferase 1